MWVTGSGSLANVVSFTPGAVGITQATNALALETCCDVANGTAVAYSTAQQLIIDRLERRPSRSSSSCSSSAGPAASCSSASAYTDAKVKVAEQKEQRAAKRAGQASREGRRVTAAPSPAAYGESRLLAARTAAVQAASPAPLVGDHSGVARGRRRDPARRRHRGQPAARSLVAAVVAVLNAMLPPVLAALRLPFMLALGFLLVLA